MPPEPKSMKITQLEGLHVPVCHHFSATSKSPKETFISVETNKNDPVLLKIILLML